MLDKPCNINSVHISENVQNKIYDLQYQLWTIYRPDKKNWNWTFHIWQYYKLSNINIAAVSEHAINIASNLKTQLLQFNDKLK